MNKKTSYKIGGMLALSAVLLSPIMASAATDTGDTTINATVNSTLSMTTSGTVAMSVTPTGAGVGSSAKDTITVSTNNPSGYDLSLEADDAITTLSNGSDTLAAQVTPGALANNSWGYSLDATAAESNVTTLVGTWNGVPAAGSATSIKTTATTAASDVTDVWYGVKADTTKESGVYTGTVTYTAVTNV
ncbi:MAG TPA: hypothetical protein VFM68_03275 [Candidatus Saccharimonadales bacterium]|nr:hypothetical protein [Candidatus Saccharimonadales bacterium]